MRRTQARGAPVRRGGRQAHRHEVGRLRRAEERARALAPARGLGLQPLAPLRRDAPLRPARHHARRLWEQLRDDHRSLAQLASRHGWPDPRKLATALTAPEAAKVGPARAKLLRERALRTITQGHLAQHLFFHSLHQFGIASEAPAIFGVTDVEFRRLRRAELSPLAIARLHGRSPGQVEALAIAVLRERAQTGVRGHAIPPAQADRLLRRQLSQLPRWLDQARYNGPPTTYRGALEAVPHDYASNPAISADGRHVAYESYRQKLPLAIKFGEIAVLRADLSTGKTAIVSRLPHGGPTGPDPISAYNATALGGRLADRVRVIARQPELRQALRPDRRPARRRRADQRPRQAQRRHPRSQSAYNPAMSADGSRVAYQAVRDGRTVVLVSDARGRTRTVVRGAGVGGATFADPYEPALSADGSKLVYTLATGRADDPAGATSQVLVRDVATGRTTVASRTSEGAIGDGFSADPAISPDGRFVAFTSDAPNLGAARGRAGLFVRDLRDGRTRQVPTGTARVLDPVASRSARVVAFTAMQGATAQIIAWTRRTGAVSQHHPRNASSEDASISDDGRRIAFVSAATNLDSRQTDGSRAIFVRDRHAKTTRAVSDTTAAYPKGVLKPPAVKPAPAPAPAAAPSARRATTCSSPTTRSCATATGRP